MRSELPSDVNKVLLKRFSEWLAVQQFARQTRARYPKVVRRFVRFLGGRRLTETTHSDVQQYLGECAKQGKSVNVLEIELRGLRSVFDFLCLGGLVKWCPPRMMTVPSRPRSPRCLTKAGIRKLFAAATSPRDRVVLEVLYGTGCRAGELSAMRVEDIDFEGRKIRVRGKFWKVRYLMMTARLCGVLRRYLGIRRTGYLLGSGRPPQEVRPFPTPSGAWYTHYRVYNETGKNLGGVVRYLPAGVCVTSEEAAAEIRRRWPDRIARPEGIKRSSPAFIHVIVSNIGAKAGIRVSPHMLRHSLATHLLDNGADLRAVSTCLGHSSLRSTMVYLHADQKMARASFVRSHPLK
jgi:integrase/recombinase XerD